VTSAERTGRPERQAAVRRRICVIVAVGGRFRGGFVEFLYTHCLRLCQLFSEHASDSRSSRDRLRLRRISRQRVDNLQSLIVVDN